MTDYCLTLNTYIMFKNFKTESLNKIQMNNFVGAKDPEVGVSVTYDFAAAMRRREHRRESGYYKRQNRRK